MSAGFHNIQFPIALSFGASGGPERRTEIVTTRSGREERNTPWANARRRYDAGISMRSLDDVARVIEFFEARHGQLYSFRWKDWSDYKSCAPSEAISAEDQVIAIGDGAQTVFQLIKTYASGGHAAVRDITKPVATTVRVAVDGTEIDPSQFEVDVLTGQVTFQDAPSANMPITAGYEFDVPARFDVDYLPINVATFQAGQIPSIPVIEVRE